MLDRVKIIVVKCIISVYSINVCWNLAIDASCLSHNQACSDNITSRWLIIWGEKVCNDFASQRHWDLVFLSISQICKNSFMWISSFYIFTAFSAGIRVMCQTWESFCFPHACVAIIPLLSLLSATRTGAKPAPCTHKSQFSSPFRSLRRTQHQF